MDNGVDLDATFNLADMPDAEEFVVIPEGSYHVVCTDQQWGLSKVGNPKLDFRLKVLAGAHHGASFVDTITFTPGSTSMKRVRFVLSHFGDMEIGPNFSLKDVDLRGRQAIAHVLVEQREYNGRTYDNNKVHFTGYSRPEGFCYLPADGAPPAATAPHPATPTPMSAPAAAAPPPPPPPALQLSPDGRFQWDAASAQWIPYAPPAQPPLHPPPPSSAAPLAYPVPSGLAPARADGMPF